MSNRATTATTQERNSVVAGEPIPFIDLGAQRRRIGKRMDDAILRVVDHGKYILGPEVKDLEGKLAEVGNTRHAISCSSGTDALLLALLAWGIGRGDAVFVPAFTFAATAEVVALVGATPIFCDVLKDTFNLDPKSLGSAIEHAKANRLLPRVVIVVDLFGQPADYRAIAPIAKHHGIDILGDAAQSFGATLDGQPVGSLCDTTSTSFFPAKPLGCYGDGGAIFTNDGSLAERLLSLRGHGGGKDKYDNQRVGINGRLDTIQAAVLLEKLAIFEDEIERRQRIAERYDVALADVVATPALMDGATSVWAQYTIVSEKRDAIAAHLRDCGIPTAIYYPLPLNRQTAYSKYPTAPGDTPVSDWLAERVISLPMHPYLDEATQDRIVAAVRSAV